MSSVAGNQPKQVFVLVLLPRECFWVLTALYYPVVVLNHLGSFDHNVVTLFDHLLPLNALLVQWMELLVHLGYDLLGSEI